MIFVISTLDWYNIFIINTYTSKSNIDINTYKYDIQIIAL